jgi:hypothetical protein
MTKEDIALAKSLFRVVVGLLPGGAQSDPILSALIDKLLAVRSPSAGQLDRAVTDAAREISKKMVAAEQSPEISKGSGHAAVIDLTGILERAEITPVLLVQFELDTDRLYIYLTEVARVNLDEASPGRRGMLEDALRQIAATVMALASDLSSVRLEFMKEVLRRTRR